jgi:hypothetical protein
MNPGVTPPYAGRRLRKTTVPAMTKARSAIPPPATPMGKVEFESSSPSAAIAAGIKVDVVVVGGTVVVELVVVGGTVVVELVVVVSSGGCVVVVVGRGRVVVVVVVVGRGRVVVVVGGAVVGGVVVVGGVSTMSVNPEVPPTSSKNV